MEEFDREVKGCVDARNGLEPFFTVQRVKTPLPNTVTVTLQFSARSSRVSDSRPLCHYFVLQEMEEYDREVKERVDARNGLESFVYSVKQQLEDEDSEQYQSLSEDDRNDLEDAVTEVLDWLEENQAAGMRTVHSDKSFSALVHYTPRQGSISLSFSPSLYICIKCMRIALRTVCRKIWQQVLHA